MAMVMVVDDWEEEEETLKPRRNCGRDVPRLARDKVLSDCREGDPVLIYHDYHLRAVNHSPE